VKELRYVELDEALRRLEAGVKPLNVVEEAAVEEAAGRVLASEVEAPHDLPRLDVAHFDGYAVRSVDASSPSKLLKLAERSVVKRGEACFVATGQPLPEGADAVVELESVELVNGGVLVHRVAKPWLNVTRRGSDLKAGAIVAERGRRLGPRDVKALLALGVSRVRVYARPKVLVAPTGDEFVEDPSKDTHTPFARKVLEAGGAVVEAGHPISDSVEEAVDALAQGLESFDAVFTIGGASIGPRDVMWEAALRLGAAPLFRGVKVVPGRVTSCAILGGKPIVLLPGHVQSLLVGLCFIALPALRALSTGSATPLRPLGVVELASVPEFKGFEGFKRVVFVKLMAPGLAEALAGDSSMIGPIALSDGFVVLEPGRRSRSACFYRPFEVYGP